MAEIGWDDSYSVNIYEIDKQHQYLFSLIEELYQATTEGKAVDGLSKVINGLVHYVEVHFSTEEFYFKKYNYPESDSHTNEHLNFIIKVAEFKKGLIEKRISLSLDILKFLNNWLVNHILISDKKYSAFLNAKGVN